MCASARRAVPVGGGLCLALLQTSLQLHSRTTTLITLAVISKELFLARIQVNNSIYF